MADEPRYLMLLRAEVERSGSRGRVAQQLGISRSAVSMLLSGTYPGGTDRMAELILSQLDTVVCPHTGETLSRPACAEIAGRPVPTSSPDALRHWRACQRCDHRLEGG